MTTIKRKYHNWFPRLISVKAITLYPYILFAKSINYHSTRPETFNALMKHEYIHINQVRKVGFFKFYLTYFFKKNEVEGEAYLHQYDELNEEELTAIKTDLKMVKI